MKTKERSEKLLAEFTSILLWINIDFHALLLLLLLLLLPVWRIISTLLQAIAVSCRISIFLLEG
jgi:hypothetical protein